MNTGYFDSRLSDDARRDELYRGQLFVYSPTPGTIGLVELARTLICEAFGDVDPETAQYHMPVEEYAATLGALKPKFIHHPDSKRFIQQILAERGCDLSQTYFDVPRLRTATSDDYLTTGIAYAFHPHRDTWYSAPQCQINWWMPVYELNSENCMALHPHYFERAIKNGSSTYNYHRWNLESRHNAAQHVKTDTRVQPRPEEQIDLDPQMRLVCDIGGAYQFSAAHLHSTVPNTSGKTRYSIDFRTVHLGDVVSRTGARNVDADCTGTTMGDYLRGTDGSHLPEEAIALYQDGTEVEYTKA